ncbi:MAG TPA: HoxN/HupN/NixA family nickel/cobalt transporter [Thermoplasmata archaeon]|nr:HoxN/HupN/NixA family nickel/cobalt transporter [Thermoplasmata archaeon]
MPTTTGPGLASAGGPGDLALTRSERALILLLVGGILVATLLAFLGAFRFLPAHYAGQVTGGGLIFTGLAITAYILGVRHGFDVDHIAAIDNTTRKLLNDGKRPLTVGTWFSLGHSTIVCGMIVALVVAIDFIRQTYTTFATVGAVLGTAISGTFLFVIGLVNVIIVLEVYRLFKGLRTGRLDQKALDEQMNKRGFMYRYFGRLFKVINEPWQIYPIGVLFGLGFDTATEVLLIGLAVGAAYSGIPLWAVLFLPALFTCGMVLSDTADGVSMRYAYGWAFSHPIRKVFYNLTLTVISVLVAFVIGGIELLQVVAGELGWGGWFWGGLQSLDFESLGFGVVGLFVGCWAVALVVYRWKGYEKVGFGPTPPPPPGGQEALPGP